MKKLLSTSLEQKFLALLEQIAKLYPQSEEESHFTDIHLRFLSEAADLVAFDDEDKELGRLSLSDVANQDSGFPLEALAAELRVLLQANAHVAEAPGLSKPYSYTLEDEDGEQVAELYITDDELAILGGDLMKGLDEELDSFLEKLIES